MSPVGHVKRDPSTLDLVKSPIQWKKQPVEHAAWHRTTSACPPVERVLQAWMRAKPVHPLNITSTGH